MTKLLDLNVNPVLVRVVQSFLSNRQQRVKYNGTLSSYKHSTIGVPQGTIMGPLLWNAFVHDLSPNIRHVKYADDTTIYNTVSRSDVTITNSNAHKATIVFSSNPLQDAAFYAASWCDANSMLLNTAKSTTITFTLQKDITCADIIIKDTPIEDSSSVKLLGVTFDQHLKFSAHVDATIAKAKPAFHALVLLRKAGVGEKGLVLFYRTRILSILSYAAPCWYPFANAYDRDKLERYQKLCLRIITPNLDTYEDRKSHLNMLDLSQYLEITCLRYMDKLRLNPGHPLYDYTKLAPPNSHHPERYKPKHRTALLGKNIFYKY